MRFKRPQVRYADTPQPATPYQAAAQVWDDRIGSSRVQAKNWRFMAFGCLLLALLMAGGLVWRSAQSIVTPYVIEVDQAGQVRTVGEAATQYRPADAQIAFHLAHFVTLVRSLSIDPIVVRQNWLDAYDYTTDKGAAVLNDYARTNDPFARIGRESVTVQITSVVRASDTSFNVRWTERRYVNGAAAGLERWTAVVSIVLQTPRTEERLRRNPWVSTSMVCRGAANLKPRKERSHESTSTTQCRRTVARFRAARKGGLLRTNTGSACAMASPWRGPCSRRACGWTNGRSTRFAC